MPDTGLWWFRPCHRKLLLTQVQAFSPTDWWVFWSFPKCVLKPLKLSGRCQAVRGPISQSPDTRMAQSRNHWGCCQWCSCLFVFKWYDWWRFLLGLLGMVVMLLLSLLLLLFWFLVFSSICCCLHNSIASDAQSLAAMVQATPLESFSHTGGKTSSLSQKSPNIQLPKCPIFALFQPWHQPSLSERACPIAAKMAKSLNSSRNYSSAPIYPAMEEYGAGLSCPMGICL